MRALPDYPGKIAQGSVDLMRKRHFTDASGNLECPATWDEMITIRAPALTHVPPPGEWEVCNNDAYRLALTRFMVLDSGAVLSGCSVRPLAVPRCCVSAFMGRVHRCLEEAVYNPGTIRPSHQASS